MADTPAMSMSGSAASESSVTPKLESDMPISPNADIKTIQKFTTPEPFYYGIYFSAQKRGAGSPLGHAFAVFHKGKEAPAWVTTESFGLYPKADKSYWEAIFGVPGVIAKFEETTDLGLHAFVSSGTFTKVLAKAKEFEAKAPTYGLMTMDTCVTLLKPLAEVAGLTAPSVWANPYPEDWVKALMNINN